MSAGKESYGADVVTAQPVNNEPAVNTSPLYTSYSSIQQPTIVSTGYATQAFPAQGQVIPSQGQPNNRRSRPSPNRWADTICDWPSNLFPSCWCACCCCYGIYLVAQMSEKTNFAKFNTIIGVFSVVWVLSFILQLAVPGGVGAIIVWLPLIFSFLTALFLRIHIVRKYHIVECGSAPASNECGEGLVGFFCWYCSVAQMARFLYGYTKVFDGDSDIYRPDNYDTPSPV